MYVEIIGVGLWLHNNDNICEKRTDKKLIPVSMGSDDTFIHLLFF